MAKTKPRLYLRRFLNQAGHHATAAILVQVGRNGVICDVSDCDRVIKFDFNGWRPSERKNSLYKINVLIDTLTQLRSAMVEEYASKVEREEY